MFPKSDWYERNLPDVGMWLFCVGLGCPFLAFLAEVLSGARSENVDWLFQTLDVIRVVASALAEPLIYNGVILYLVGRIAGAWMVTIVGFEHAPTSKLLIKGPDADNTVWIGRSYPSVVEAAAAAAAIVRRGGHPSS